ncbi:MAG: helix-turn-helix transcriptional regulator [Frankia sp.]
MTTATERLTRLLALVPWLRARPGVFVADAAREFGITERQLREDLELLWVCGLPGGSPGDLIDISYEGDRVTVVDPQTLERPLRLTADEAMTLVVAAKALAHVRSSTERDALDRARRKLEAAVAVPLGGVEVALDRPVDDSVLTDLRSAITNSRRVHLRYVVWGRDELTERDVDPMRVLYQDGRWYLEGWCHSATAMRMFRVDRITGMRVLDLPAAPPPDAVPRDTSRGVYRPSPSDARVVLALTPAARWVTDYYPAESVAPGEDGGLLLTVRAADPSWIRRLVLGLGGHARVVEPPELAEEVHRAAIQALAAYEAPM